MRSSIISRWYKIFSVALHHDIFLFLRVAVCSAAWLGGGRRGKKATAQRHQYIWRDLKNITISWHVGARPNERAHQSDGGEVESLVAKCISAARNAVAWRLVASAKRRNVGRAGDDVSARQILRALARRACPKVGLCDR